jgi:type I restriction enzyme R subunit
MTPEQQARQEIDRLLQSAGWHVCGVSDANIHAARGVAIREFALDGGYGYADYLLYVDGKAAGFNSPSLAGRAAIGGKRAVNGWLFWSYERAPGDWVRLDELRK